MITVLIMFSIVIVYVIIYKTNHYLLTHKEAPWTYPRLHKCRCGGKPQVKWSYSPDFNYETHKLCGLRGIYEVKINCPKCGFSVTVNRHYNLSTKGNNFKTIPDPGSINRANMKAIRAWNETSPEKCEECDR